jgi:hypothetical protein
MPRAFGATPRAMASVRSIAWWLPWVLVACVTECDEPPQRVVGRVAQPEATEPAAAPAEAPATEPAPAADDEEPTEPDSAERKGPVVAADAFEPFVPDKLADYAAEAPAEHVEMTVPGEHDVTALKRTYKKGRTTLRLELIDALYTPTPIQLVNNSQGTQRKMKSIEYDGQSIGGHPGLLQWNQRKRTAKASVVLRGRYLVNVQIEPAEDTAEALRLLEDLPLDRIAALEPTAP